MKIICLFEFTISVKIFFKLCAKLFKSLYLPPPVLLNNIKYITFSYIKNK